MSMQRMILNPDSMEEERNWTKSK